MSLWYWFFFSFLG